MKIFFDEDSSHHLAHGFAAFQTGRKGESIEVLHCAEKFGRGAKDEDWLPQVAKMHGIVITQDLNIHRVKAQWELCQKYKVGIFFFRPPKGTRYDYWHWIAEVMRHWSSIKGLSGDTKRPFAYLIKPRSARPEKI